MTLISTLILLLMLGCGGVDVPSQGPQITYRLARHFTNSSENTLIVEVDEISKALGYKYAIEGQGFVADPPVGATTSVNQVTKLTYDAEATYTLRLRVFNSSGLTIIRENLSWEYNLEVPSAPRLSFGMDATNSQDVTLLLGAPLELKTVEIWVQGQLERNSGGSWALIPSNLRFPLRLEAEDGDKKLFVKYRNIYGSETELQEISLLKDTIAPEECVATLPGTAWDLPSLRLYAAASDAHSLRVQVVGDVESNPLLDFEKELSFEVGLVPPGGKKNITVKIQDIAGNQCPDLPLELDYQPGVNPLSIEIKDKVLWTQDRKVTLVSNFNHLPSDEPEIFVHGPHVEKVDGDEASVGAWVPYQKEIPIELRGPDGRRDIFSKFRINPTAEETVVVITDIYLQPRIFFRNNLVTVSAGEDLENVSLEGCEEVYKNSAIAASYPCTPSAANLSATLVFNDSSSLDLSLKFP